MNEKTPKGKAYSSIVSKIFERHYKKGKKSFEFGRDEIAAVARELGVGVPRNVGDVVYSFRYRNSFPEDIASTAKDGFERTIEGVGIGRYAMKQVRQHLIVPREDLVAVKIPDSTPEIIAKYAQSDEQSLLAKIRYNRLIDIFLGIAAYSLQNHLRTTVKGIGQIEIDEIYVAIDKAGAQYIIPVQAKTGKDKHSAVQTKQDIACCLGKFPHLMCRAVSAQFARDGIIAMFELVLEDEDIRVAQERHYRLVPSDSITPEDLKSYRTFSPRT